MKKKILLGAIMILALACLFAISISAVEVDGVHYKLDTKNLTAQVSQDNRTATTEIVTIPSTFEYEGATYKVTSIANDAFRDNRNMVELRILSEYITQIPASMIANIYGKDTDGDKVNDTGDKLKKIYIDFSNITSIGSAAFNPSNQTNGNDPKVNSFYYYDAKAFLENGSDVLITCPDFSNCTSIGAAAFQGANFKKIVVPAGCSITTQTFRKSTVEEVVILGSERTAINYYVFDDCKSLKTIRIESPIETYSNNIFSGCTAVEAIYVDMSHVTSVGTSAFCFSTAYDAGNTTTQWYNLDGEKIVDLSSLTDLSTGTRGTFASSNIGSAQIIWPKALNNFPNQTFRKCNITCPMYINMAEGKTATVEYYALDGNTPSIIVLGNGVTAYQAKVHGAVVIALEDTIALNKDSKNANATYYYKSSTEELTGDKYVKITDATATTYGACGLTASVTLTDGTTESFNYVTHDYKGVVDNTVCPLGSLTLYTCAGCQNTYEETTDAFVSKEHNFDLENGAAVLEIIYLNNNYFANGNVVIKCASCEATNKDTEFGALFTAVGYSESEIYGGFISHTIKVNIDNVNEYERLTGVTVRYGLVAAIHSDGKPIYLDGDKIAVAEKAYSLEMTGTEYNNLLIKINGITDDRAMNCNAYAIINGEITYLCGDVASSTASAKSLSISPELVSSILVDVQVPENKQYA